MKYLRPKIINYRLFNKFTGELYLSVSNWRYDRAEMVNGRMRKIILRQKQVCAQSWGVDKRFVKLKLEKQY